MTVLQLFNRWFYFYEDTPYRSCLCRNGDAIIRPSTDKVGSRCFSQVLLRGSPSWSSINNSGDNKGMCFLEGEPRSR